MPKWGLRLGNELRLPRSLSPRLAEHKVRGRGLDLSTFSWLRPGEHPRLLADGGWGGGGELLFLLSFWSLGLGVYCGAGSKSFLLLELLIFLDKVLVLLTRLL